MQDAILSRFFIEISMVAPPRKLWNPEGITPFDPLAGPDNPQKTLKRRPTDKWAENTSLKNSPEAYEIEWLSRFPW